MKRIALLATALASAAAGAALFAVLAPVMGQEAAGAGSALDTFAATGNRVQVSTLMTALSRPNRAKTRPDSSFSLFIPDPFQLMEYGDKAGVHAFLRSLPEKSRVTILVSDARKLGAIGDKEPVQLFMKALARKSVAVDLLVTDVAGLSYVGEKESLIAFVAGLPENSVVKLFTTPGEISNNGADAGLLRFIDSVACRLELHVDDPMVRCYLSR